MYPYQNQPSGHQGPSSSQQFLENVETAASRFKRAFGRKRPSRAGEDPDQATQSDAPSSRRMTPVSRISQFIPRKDPKAALQVASSSFQTLGQRMNKPLPPRVSSQIGPPPDLDLSKLQPPSPPPPEQSSRRTSEEPRKSHSKARSSPVPVNRKSVYRSSQLVGAPEISAAIEYMLDSPKHSVSPPRPKAPVPEPVPALPGTSPPSPKVIRRGSYGKDSATTTTTAANTGKRRSMSLSMMPNFQAINPAPPVQPSSSYQAPPSSFTLSQPPNAPHQRSHSTLPNFTSPTSASEPRAAKTDAYASGIISHTNPDKSSNTFKGKLAAWTTPPTTPTPSPSRSNRNPSPSHSKTVSMVASIGPAATAATGLAMNFSKRAYEKVNSMLGGPASASPLSAGIHSQHGSEPSGNIARVKSRLNGTSHNGGGYGGSFSDVETSRRRTGGRSGSPGDGMQEQPVGPNLGTMLRPPFRRSLPGGGLVFGRPLADCVRDTKPLVVLGDENGVGIEARFIPALVLRCVQHIERWGITEEGLFRISGRTSHINKLRVEFASGADYDLQMCGPGDLDPHAVASVLKAFLRELPEPILTRAKAPLYDAAFERAKDASFMLATSSAPSTLGYNPSNYMGLPYGPKMGLPSGPRDVSSLPSRNRHPAASTQPEPLVYDDTEGASTTPQEALDDLVAEFYELTWSLPRENRDLLLTITELLQKAAGESKTTKMPLSNLLLVLCPSMSMNPGVLKIFVEHHQAIFAERKQVPPEETYVKPAKVVEHPLPEPQIFVKVTPNEQPSETLTQMESTRVEATSEGSKQVSEEMIATTALPVRKQSLRRLVHNSQGPRTTPTSSPSAYKETFGVDAAPNHSDAPAAGDVIVEPPRNASRPTSPLHQSFSSSDLSRPGQPLGPRAQRNVPAPLALQRERSNTPERNQTVSRPRHAHSTSSLSSTVRDALPSPGLPQPNKVEEPKVVQPLPEFHFDAQPLPSPQILDSGPPSSQGNTLIVPTLPDVSIQPPMTSSFANRRSAMPMTRMDQVQPSPGHSDGPSPVTTPQTADSGMSSQSNTITIPPSLPEVHSLPPMTSSFANRRSTMPMPRNEQGQSSPASLNVPSPDSTRSVVQPLTPLLDAMEKEHATNASGLPPSPDPNSEQQLKTHPRVEPLTVVKKHTSHNQEPNSATSTASSAYTDSSDTTNIFDQQLPWPEVPKTIPMVKPGYYAALNQQPSAYASMKSPFESSSMSADQDATAQYVTANEPDSSDLTATVDQSKFPSELYEDDPPASPDVANSQYPPEPYPSLQPLPQASEIPRTKKIEPSTHSEPPKRITITSAHSRAKKSVSGDVYSAIPSADTTMRPTRAHAPRLTVNSKELLAGNSYWANELQRALRSSPPTSPHEARHSAELSSMLEAAGT